MASFYKLTGTRTARTCFSAAAFGVFIIFCMFFSASIVSCSGLFSEQKDNSTVTFTLPSSVLKSLTTSTTVLSGSSKSRSVTVSSGSTVSLSITISGGISYSGTFSRTITVENDTYSIDPVTISGLNSGKTVTIAVSLYNTDGTLVYTGTSDTLTLSEGTNTAAITLTAVSDSSTDTGTTTTDSGSSSSSTVSIVYTLNLPSATLATEAGQSLLVSYTFGNSSASSTMTVSGSSGSYTLGTLTLSGLTAEESISSTFTVSTSGGMELYTGSDTTTAPSSDSGTETISLASASTVTSTTLASCTTPLSFVPVAGGSFTMGSDSDSSTDNTAHTATVSDFYMSTTEITLNQFDTVMLSLSGTEYPATAITWYQAAYFCNLLSEKDSLNPVYYVTVDGTNVTDPTSWGTLPTTTSSTLDIEQDLTKNGYRLPTETEWEYAANGGVHKSGYTYSGCATDSDYASYMVYGTTSAATVGSKSPNALGIYDMSGNVWEWCWDYYSDSTTNQDYESTATNTDYTGPTSTSSTTSAYRVLRGGCYDSKAAANCAVYYRFDIAPSTSSNYYGFRVVRRP